MRTIARNYKENGPVVRILSILGSRRNNINNTVHAVLKTLSKLGLVVPYIMVSVGKLIGSPWFAVFEGFFNPEFRGSRLACDILILADFFLAFQGSQ